MTKTSNHRYRYSADLGNELRNLMTVTGVIKLFGVSPVTVHQWRTVRANPIPTVYIPGERRDAVRFYKPDVLEWARHEEIPTIEDSRVQRDGHPAARVQRVQRVQHAA